MSPINLLQSKTIKLTPPKTAALNRLCSDAKVGTFVFFHCFVVLRKTEKVGIQHITVAVTCRTEVLVIILPRKLKVL